MAKSLIIVESPTKARTMTRYLGKQYTVDSCMGHVRDLPKSKFGVDLEAGFKPDYVTIRGKSAILKKLAKKAAAAECVYLAPDPDREGEAIAWHLISALKLPTDKFRRITFDEFTKRAITEALSHPGKLSMNLVNAQQARRILDRIVGYKISPLLWKKIARGLSAGRVQSVAVRLIVEREQKIRAFEARPQSEKEYWTVMAKLHHQDHTDQPFDADLKTPDKKTLKTAEQTNGILEDVREQSFIVSVVQAKNERKNAPPPFSTDLLLQQASIHLRFSTKKTGVIAQQLYEGIDVGQGGPTGLITYMRTDSYNLSKAAVDECRNFIVGKFGKDYLPAKANVYRAGKGAQEAHEAVRPTDVELTPESVKSALTTDQFKLYELIWKRFVACQMPPAQFNSTVVDIAAGEHTFVARGRQMLFDGHLKMALKGKFEDDTFLPPLAERDNLIVDEITPTQHFEQPPPRYSEATLVAALKKLGIGRPSTYSAIVSTIQNRKYVQTIKRRFHATALGEVVTDRLVKHFPTVLDARFTSKMEDDLDEIAEGKLDWKDVLAKFYKGFSDNLEKAETEMEKAVQESEHPCPKCGKLMVFRFSKSGRFLACSGYPDCKQTLPVDDDDNVVERPEPEETEHKCPECGSPLIRRDGRRGEFLACSAYPKCKTTFNIDAEGNPVSRPEPIPTDQKCPKCGKPMVIRDGRRGKFLACSGYPKCKTTANLDNEDKSTTTKSAEPVKTDQKCPECGEPMVIRSGRRGKFLACSAYPKCKTTKSLESSEPKAKTKSAAGPKPKSTGVKCPEDGCDGELLERKGRYGIFYGCSNYPKCKHTEKELPADVDEVE